MKNSEKFDKEKYFEELKTYEIGREIIHFDNIDSTNLEAKRRIKDNLKNGTVILADTQSNGSGRFKRKWVSPIGGLWFSIVLKTDIIQREAPKITIIAGASINKALNKYNINTKIKWPNDIYLNEKKLCGILSEMYKNNIIIGIGLNINVDENEIEESIKDSATSLKIEFDKKFDKYKIFVDILKTFEELYNDFALYNSIDEVIDICRTSSCVFGRKADLIIGNRVEEVICTDISENGNLIIKDKEERIREIFSGEISFKNK